MYGRKSTNILAAFGAVNQIANACSFLFNYLIDGVASKVCDTTVAVVVLKIIIKRLRTYSSL